MRLINIDAAPGAPNSVFYTGGVDLEVDDPREIEIDSANESPSPSNRRVIWDDIDFDGSSSAPIVFSDITDLPTVLNELTLAPWPQDAVSGSSAISLFWSFGGG